MEYPRVVPNSDGAGVVDQVAASLKNNYPGLDWSKTIPYNLERMARHGERRASEMEEVAETLRELGVEPLMSNAAVKRQREMGQIGTQQSVLGALEKDGGAILNAISAAARDRHRDTLAELPAYALQLSRGYPAIPTVFE